MANTTPAVNLDPNFTKNSTYPKIAQRAFVFDINDAQNGVFLPTSDTAAQAAHARDASINAAGQLVLIRCGAWITWNYCWPASTIRTRRAYAG